MKEKCLTIPNQIVTFHLAKDLLSFLMKVAIIMYQIMIIKY